MTEAPVLARSTGYIKDRLVDIGDRVKAGQLLAEIEAPELDQQVEQAQASLNQARAALDQSVANSDQGKSNLDLARITARRYGNLAAQGVVSKQENDQYQAAYQSQQAGLDALGKAIAASKSAVASSEANLQRLREMQAYKQVRAPFEGVITVRNIDTGALITAGSTLLYRIAQIGMLRTYVNVPQAYSDAVKVGQTARLSVANLPGRVFLGRVGRTASALDPTSRTLLVEVQVPNTSGDLLPGMYADVDLNIPVLDPPISLPADALVVRSDGTQVAVMRPDGTVHFQKIEIAADYGDHLDLASGLRCGRPRNSASQRFHSRRSQGPGCSGAQDSLGFTVFPGRTSTPIMRLRQDLKTQRRAGVRNTASAVRVVRSEACCTVLWLSACAPPRCPCSSLGKQPDRLPLLRRPPRHLPPRHLPPRHLPPRPVPPARLRRTALPVLAWSPILRD